MRTTSCRRDEHGYGFSVAIGSGLLRRSCTRCGDVELDIRIANTGDDALVAGPSHRSMFARGWNDTRGGMNFAAGA